MEDPLLCIKCDVWLKNRYSYEYHLSTVHPFPMYYAVVNDLIGGYDVSQYNKPVGDHNHELGEYSIGTFLTQEWAERVANALNKESNARTN